MISEQEFKNWMIENLAKETQSSEWIDGDMLGVESKTPDLINFYLNIAIEIKDDRLFVHPKVTKSGVFWTNNLTKIQSQVKSDIRDANKKFRNFTDQISILLLRSEHNSHTFKKLLNGIVRFGHNESSGTFRLPNTGVGFTSSSESVDYFTFYNPLYGELFWVKNHRSKPEKILNINETLRFLNPVTF